MADDLGPRAQRVYRSLHDRIVREELTPGTQLASHLDLAEEFGVSPVTMRRVLAELESDGLVSRQQGRGTFIQRVTRSGVLVVDDDAPTLQVLLAHAQAAGHRGIGATGPDEALAVLQEDPAIALVLTDVRMPDTETGIRFIRALHHRWPDVPVAAVTGYARDLDQLLGTPECPVLVLSKPVWAHQIQAVLRLATGSASRASRRAPSPTTDAIVMTKAPL